MTVNATNMTEAKARRIFGLPVDEPLDLDVLEVIFSNLRSAYSLARFTMVLHAIDADRAKADKNYVAPKDRLPVECQLIGDLHQLAFDVLVESIGATSQWAVSKSARPKQKAMKGV